MDELKALARQGIGLAVVTHDMRLRPFADKMVYVNDGRVSDTPPPDDFH
jgi:putative ABC transport system ATP-binding protein